MKYDDTYLKKEEKSGKQCTNRQALSNIHIRLPLAKSHEKENIGVAPIPIPGSRYTC